MDTDLIPVEDAARELGIPEKRLVGFMARTYPGLAKAMAEQWGAASEANEVRK